MESIVRGERVPHAHKIVGMNGILYRPILLNDEMVIKEIIEEHLKRDFWERLKQKIERTSAILCTTTAF